MTARFTHGHAVVVGVGADLPVTVADAKGVAKLLRDPARCAYPTDQVQLLTGPSARRQDVLDALDRLAKETEGVPDATAIVFFSGHGAEDGEYYLIPFGFDPTAVADTAISSREFTQKLRAIRAKKLLVLLDCCHAGGIGEAKRAKSPVPPGVFEELRAGSGRVIVASSRKDELSWTGTPYSVFTGALLEGLAGYGAFERDGYARVLDLTLWVGRKTPERTKDQQHPIIKVSDLEENFALAYYAAGETTPKALDWSPIVPGGAGVPTGEQADTWRKMLGNYRSNLRLIEERMSEFVEFAAVPLQLVKDKRQTEAKIAELEGKLGIGG